ncbi:MAG: tyramine oxidase [Frondihabitans sp.]|nr:tyramine oxidase [Frondihabitans sp.]
MTLAVALAAPHEAAVAAARAAVEVGGNALDAALAAAAVLTVVYPHQCSLGGDLVALIEHDGVTRAVVSVGAAPKAIDPARLAEEPRMPRQGADTVTVPGVVAGWQAIARLGARLPLASALTRAASLADAGTTVSKGLGRALRDRRAHVLADAGLREIFTRDGELLADGDALPQPALARTLRRLAADPDDFYRGETAAALVDRIRGLGGSIDTSDFADHEAEVTAAVTRRIRGVAWSVAPPPSQGVVLLSILPVSTVDAPTASLVAAYTAAADSRRRHLGDPRGGTIDTSALLGEASSSSAGEPPRPGHALGDTVAITAQDSDGTVVSLIQSVYQWFGSGILDPATGIVLHNRGSAFSTDPSHPAHIGPGLRPPHTLCPLLATSDDLTVAFGCQGGSAQPWILAQIAEALLDPSADPAEVLSRPRWVVGAQDLGHSETTVVAEPGRDDAIAAGLAQGLGVDLHDRLIDEAGHVQIVRRHHRRDMPFDTASDPRADGLGVVMTAAASPAPRSSSEGER